MPNLYKFLDATGLGLLWNKVTELLAQKANTTDIQAINTTLANKIESITVTFTQDQEVSTRLIADTPIEALVEAYHQGKIIYGCFNQQTGPASLEFKCIGKVDIINVYEQEMFNITFSLESPETTIYIIGSPDLNGENFTWTLSSQRYLYSDSNGNYNISNKKVINLANPTGNTDAANKKYVDDTVAAFTETDPTVPSWAKAQNKPTYTASEVGAPTVAEMNTAIGTAIGNVHQFELSIVQELPTQDIDTHTIYLVPKTGETNDVYDEYVYINDGWEMIGNTQIDLSNYATIPDMNKRAPAIYTIGASPITNAVPNMPFKSLILTIAGDPTDVGTSSASIIVGPSTTAAEGTTYTKSFDPIYEGALDFVSGKLTITKAILDLSSIGYNYDATHHYFYSQALYGFIDTNEPIYSSDMTVHTVEEIQSGEEGVAFGGATYIYVYDDEYIGMTIDEFKAAVAGKYVAYTLRTPQVVELGATEIRALNGTTYIMSDDGTVSIEYQADTKDYVDLKADKANPVFTGSINLGRADGTTIGSNSVAVGFNNEASGVYSFAEGAGTRATGFGAHAQGTSTTASGFASHAEGAGSTASQNSAHAEGSGTIADGSFSHAEGAGAISNGDISHAEGGSTIAGGTYSHAEGNTTIANHKSQHVSGEFNVADDSSAASTARGNYAEIIGNGTANNARSNARALDWSGNEYLAGNLYVSCNTNSTSGIQVATVTDVSTKADKVDTVLDTTLSLGRKASTTAGANSIALGIQGTASGQASAAIGIQGTASGVASYAEGLNTIASNMASHAEGNQTVASGPASHAEGGYTEASGAYSHTEGQNTSAQGTWTHVEGYNTIANHVGQHVFGQFNVVDSSTATVNEIGTYVEIVGNGNFNGRSNARALDWSGNEYLAGNLYINCNTDSTSGTQVATVTDVSTKADKADTILDTTLSLGRAASTTVGANSIALGSQLTASGQTSFAEGFMNTASGYVSHAEGFNNTASQAYTHVEGFLNTADGNASHAEGAFNHVYGTQAHVEGVNNTVYGYAAHAEGYQSIAAGAYSHVSGYYNVPDSYDSWNEWAANTSYSVGDKVKRTNNNDVEGYICTTANEDSEFTSSHWQSTIGRMNQAEIIGNGNGLNDRANIRALNWNGDEYLAGDLYVQANASSTSGTRVATVSEIPNVPVQDVQVNGVSILSSGTANIPIASSTTAGVMKVTAANGAAVANEALYIVQATEAQIKAGNVSCKEISPYTQHLAVFYGLSKAAGVDLANETVAVGTYPTTAAAAIRSMIGAENGDDLIKVQDAQPSTTATKLWLPETSTTGVQVPTYDEMTTALAGKISDVQINNTSISTSGVANIPVASDSTYGVVKVKQANGVNIYDGYLWLPGPPDIDIKQGTNTTFSLKPAHQARAAFYGLAKAAGADEKDSVLEYGTYSTTAQTAIRTMIGAGTPLDVQINGTSIVNSGTVNIPIASLSALGVVKADSTGGSGIIIASDGEIKVKSAVSSVIKAGSSSYYPITPTRQHEAVFYGLAKVAGYDLASVTCTVGTYPTAAQTAIQTMLGVEKGVDLVETITGTTPSITAAPNVRYVCGEVSTISITPPAGGTCDVIFESGSTASVLTVPNTVKWPAWFDATALETDTIYEIMITDATYGSVMTWAAS